MGKIRKLDEVSINKIAAGEVIERPSSVVKELVENSLDAGASRIVVTYTDGGKSLIRVTDDGEGMSRDDLELAIERHATSKLDDQDISRIRMLGFRGEALPSMGAAGRLRIETYQEGDELGNAITVENGISTGIEPVATNAGTVVELTDLFHHTPARLKFLKSDQAEARAIKDVVRTQALATTQVRFTLHEHPRGRNPKLVLRFDAHEDPVTDREERLAAILGREFLDRSVLVANESEGLRLTGYCGLPVFNRGNSQHQYFFVNRRAVRNGQIIGAVRVAYRDLLPRGRHPAVVLHLECPWEDVDVNVHPTKADVRFRDPRRVTSFIIRSIQHALSGSRPGSSPMLSGDIVDRLVPDGRPGKPNFRSRSSPGRAHDASAGMPSPDRESSHVGDAGTATSLLDSQPLGEARAQISNTYIISQGQDGLIITDQHAAHERLVYEKLKRMYEDRKMLSRPMLVPAIVDLTQQQVDLLVDKASALSACGIVLEPFGPSTVCVRELPDLLVSANIRSLLLDLAEQIEEAGVQETVDGMINQLLIRMSCHGSIRAGRNMQPREMNALLREMESTPNSGQCPHGRPTSITISTSDLERMFRR